MRSTLKCSFAQCSLKTEINVSWSTQFGGSAVPTLRTHVPGGELMPVRA